MSHSHTTEKLVYMANQIGKFFRAQGGDAPVTGTAQHLKKFWDPRMLKGIFEYVDGGGDKLDPHVREAVIQLKKSSAEAKS